MRQLWSFVCIILCCFYSARAEEYEISWLSAQPEIDGLFTEECWLSVPWQSGLHVLGSEKPAEAQTRFKVFHDGNTLYLAVECDEPFMDDLVDEPDYNRSPAMIWLHDSIEITILPNRNLLTLYKFMINSRGAICSLFGQDDNTDRGRYVLDFPFSNSATAKTLRHPDRWALEFAVPFGALNYSEEVGSDWRFNIGRNRYTVKPPERSASSRISIPNNHMVTKDYDKVEIQNLDLSKYYWDIANPTATIQKSETGAFTCHVQADIINNTGEFRIYTAKASIVEGISNKIAGTEAEFDTVAGSYHRNELTFPLEKQGDFFLDYEIFSSQGELLKKLRTEVELRYQPLKVTVLRPAYRNNIYATMPDKHIEVQIELDEFAGIPLIVELSGESVHEIRNVEVSQPKNIVIFDATEYPTGTYCLTVRGLHPENELKSEVIIRKLPYQKGEVWLDSDGKVHYDGKPILPVGWYLQSPPDELFNTGVQRAHYKNFDAFRSQVQQHESQGRIQIYTPYQEFHPIKYNNWKWEIFRDPEDRRGQVTEPQIKKMTEFLREASKLSGIMGWYLADEPECRDHNPLWYVQMVDLMRELDPYHPTFMLNWGTGGMKKYYRGCDILMPDCYPKFYDDGSTGSPRWNSSLWMQQARELGRPRWIMVQVSPWPNFSPDGKLKGIPPTYDDFRSQFYQALIHDAKGITMYAYYDSCRFTASRLGSTAITREVRVLENLLLQNSIKGAISYSIEPQERFFQVGLKQTNEVTGIIAVNTSRKPITVDFRLKKELGERLFVAGEDRFLPVEDLKFSDVFAPCETHIYLTDSTLAAEVPSVAGVKEKIEAVRKARKKSGNLIGTGELLSGDYHNFGEGIFPEHMVRLTASTETTTYPTKDTGTLYYLLDGMTDPPQPYYAWLPKKNDLNPYVEIQFPNPTDVKEIRLYSGYGRENHTPLLQAATIQVLSEKGSFEEVGQSKKLTDNCMNIIFPPVTTNKLRVQIDQWQAQKGGWLLTEIEAY